MELEAVCGTSGQVAIFRIIRKPMVETDTYVKDFDGDFAKDRIRLAVLVVGVTGRRKTHRSQHTGYGSTPKCCAPVEAPCYKMWVCKTQ